MARTEPGVVITPTSQMRALRELEPPSTDEGLADVEHARFERTHREGQPGVLVAAAALRKPDWRHVLEQADRDAPHLLFDWNPDATVDALDDDVARLSKEVVGTVESALCPHPAGPPTCWCRPPLPGLGPRVRASTRHRPHALDARRNGTGAPNARHDARRSVRPGLGGPSFELVCEFRERAPKRGGFPV